MKKVDTKTYTTCLILLPSYSYFYVPMVRNCLLLLFSFKCVSRARYVAWPARFPHLNSFDFYF